MGQQNPVFNCRFASGQYLTNAVGLSKSSQRCALVCKGAGSNTRAPKSVKFLRAFYAPVDKGTIRRDGDGRSGAQWRGPGGVAGRDRDASGNLAQLSGTAVCTAAQKWLGEECA